MSRITIRPLHATIAVTLYQSARDDAEWTAEQGPHPLEATIHEQKVDNDTD